MSKDSQKPDFIEALEKALSSTRMKDERGNVVLDGNSAEDQEMANLDKPDYERITLSGDISGAALLGAALKIFRKEFFAFLKVNVVLTVLFLLLLFFVLLKFGSVIHSHSYTVFKAVPSLSFIGFKSILPLVLLPIFLIYFSWLRASYLAVCCNYFAFDEHYKPLRYGLKKLLSFILLECLQLVMFMLGAILFLVMWPFFAAKYFVAMPAMIEQDKKAIDAMFESREYTRGRIAATIKDMLFISIFIFLIMAVFALISAFYIKDSLIYWSLNYFLLSFILLPIHTAYRMALYKKLFHLTGELKFQISFGEKTWFVLTRLTFLTLLVFNLFLLVTGGFGSLFDDTVLLFRNLITNLKSHL